MLYSEARSGRPPIWVALENGAEIRHTASLPKGALDAMKQAADTSDALGMIWEDE